MDLGARAASALRWASSLMALGQLISWAVTIVVIRFLSPEDYGLIAIAMVFVSFLMLLNEMGMGAALVQMKDLDIDTKQKIFGFTLLINITFFVLLIVSSQLIAEFFNDQRLVKILITLSFMFLITAFETIPLANLERDMNFKAKSIILVIGNSIGGISTLILAVLDFTYWSLIYGQIINITIKTILYNYISPIRFLPKIGFRGMNEVLSFGGFVASERLMWFFYNKADVFIIGKLLGNELLGIYTVAMHLSSLIMHKLGGVLYEVSFPTFSRANEEPGLVGKYFRKATSVMSFFVFPIFFGMSAVSQEAVITLLGDRWELSGQLLFILALVMPLRMLSNVFPPALQGVGKAKISTTNLLVALIIMPAAFIVGSRWGIVGVSMSWLVIFPIVFIIMLLRTIKPIGITIKEYLSDIMMPFFISMLMFFLILLLKEAVYFDKIYTNLAAYIIVGAFIYSILSILLMKNRLSEVRDIAFRRTS